MRRDIDIPEGNPSVATNGGLAFFRKFIGWPGCYLSNIIHREASSGRCIMRASTRYLRDS